MEDIHSRRKLQQQKHAMGITTENNKRTIIIKSPPGTKLHTTISRNTNLLANGRKQNTRPAGLLFYFRYLPLMHGHQAEL